MSQVRLLKEMLIAERLKAEDGPESSTRGLRSYQVELLALTYLLDTSVWPVDEAAEQLRGGAGRHQSLAPAVLLLEMLDFYGDARRESGSEAAASPTRGFDPHRTKIVYEPWKGPSFPCLRFAAREHDGDTLEHAGHTLVIERLIRKDRVASSDAPLPIYESGSELPWHTAIQPFFKRMADCVRGVGDWPAELDAILGRGDGKSVRQQKKDDRAKALAQHHGLKDCARAAMESAIPTMAAASAAAAPHAAPQHDSTVDAGSATGNYRAYREYRGCALSEGIMATYPTQPPRYGAPPVRHLPPHHPRW